MDEGFLNEFIKIPSNPHDLERILDHQKLQSHNHICCHVLVQQKDKNEEESIWENNSSPCKRFCTFVF